ncbi:hypothetical protein D3C72_247230 [compost metagenome]
MINWIKRLFCKHDYQEFIYTKSKFQNLRGDRIYIVCTKCGHEKGSYFREY